MRERITFHKMHFLVKNLINMMIKIKYVIPILEENRNQIIMKAYW